MGRTLTGRYLGQSVSILFLNPTRKIKPMLFRVRRVFIFKKPILRLLNSFKSIQYCQNDLLHQQLSKLKEILPQWERKQLIFQTGVFKKCLSLPTSELRNQFCCEINLESHMSIEIYVICGILVENYLANGFQLPGKFAMDSA